MPFTISQSLLKFMSIESVMLSNHLIFCHLLLLPSVLFSLRVIFRVNQSIEAMTVVTRKNEKENHLNKVRVTCADKRWCVEEGRVRSESPKGLELHLRKTGWNLTRQSGGANHNSKVSLTKRSKSHHGTLRESGVEKEQDNRAQSPFSNNRCCKNMIKKET